MLTQADNDTDVPTTPTQAVSGLSTPFPQQYLIIIGGKVLPLT